MSQDRDLNFHFSTISTLAPKPSDINEKAAEHAQTPDETVKEEDSTTQSDKNQPDQNPNTTEPRARDPLRMFGILVPPALRTAQTAFRDAVDRPVVRLAAVTGQLRGLEREIGRARKAVRRA